MIRAPCDGQRALHMTADERLRKAVFQVGDGRGFKVGHFVITAAHCIPNLPPRGQKTCTGKRTYKLLGPLGVKDTIGLNCCLLIRLVISQSLVSLLIKN